MGRASPAVRTPKGLRALTKGAPIKPRGVEQYLINRFGQHLDVVRVAMEELAGSLTLGELAWQAARLCERFRPAVPKGEAGWGVAGGLELGKVTALVHT